MNGKKLLLTCNVEDQHVVLGARFAVVDSAAVLAGVRLGDRIDAQRRRPDADVEVDPLGQRLRGQVLRLGQRHVAGVDAVDRYAGVAAIPQHQRDGVLGPHRRIAWQCDLAADHRLELAIG